MNTNICEESYFLINCNIYIPDLRAERGNTSLSGEVEAGSLLQRTVTFF